MIKKFVIVIILISHLGTMGCTLQSKNSHPKVYFRFEVLDEKPDQVFRFIIKQYRNSFEKVLTSCDMC